METQSEKVVTLVDIAGHRIVKSGNLLTDGEASDRGRRRRSKESWIEASATQKRTPVWPKEPRARADVWSATGDVVGFIKAEGRERLYLRTAMNAPLGHYGSHCMGHRLTADEARHDHQCT